MNKEDNKKALYTKKELASTLLSLMAKYPYHEITILQLCQHSNISRASFYRNFNDKNEVLEFYIKNIIDTKLPDKTDPKRTFFKASDSIEVWFNEKELLKKLYDNDLFYIYTKVLNTTINKACLINNNSDSADPYYDYIATEMAYIISSIFYKWTERNFKENKKEMIELLDRLHLSRATRALIK